MHQCSNSFFFTTFEVTSQYILRMFFEEKHSENLRRNLGSENSKLREKKRWMMDAFLQPCVPVTPGTTRATGRDVARGERSRRKLLQLVLYLICSF